MPTRRSLLAGSAAITAGTLIGSPATASAHSRPTVVLVHGAFADASGWNEVARIPLHESSLDFRQHPGGYDGYVQPAAFREVFAADLCSDSWPPGPAPAASRSTPRTSP